MSFSYNHWLTILGFLQQKNRLTNWQIAGKDTPSYHSPSSWIESYQSAVLYLLRPFLIWLMLMVDALPSMMMAKEGDNCHSHQHMVRSWSSPSSMMGYCYLPSGRFCTNIANSILKHFASIVSSSSFFYCSYGNKVGEIIIIICLKMH